MGRRTTTGRSGTKCNEEHDALLSHLLALKKPQLKDFLSAQELAKSGTKAEIRDRLEAALASGALPADAVVQFLDEVTPWGKQHVFLYRGPTGSVAEWKRPAWVEQLLTSHGHHHLLNKRLPLVLPEEMTLSSIAHDGRRLRITAIRKRQWSERDTELDERRSGELGESIHLRAFVERTTRGLVAFEWDLLANAAMLQVSQLPSGTKYEDVADEFFELLEHWLDRSRFTILDLRRAIPRFHRIEEAGSGEVLSHKIDYRTIEGRRLAASSASPSSPVLGDPIIDAGLAALREKGVGHLGKFLFGDDGTANGSAATSANGSTQSGTKGVHVHIIGYRNRVRFMTATDEDTVRDVLSRIRTHCS